MRYAITGASGFIGGHLVMLLAKRGHEVLALGRDASRLGLRFAGVAGIQILPYHHDSGGNPDPVATLEETARVRKIDAAVNLAGLAHVRHAPTQAYQEGVTFARALAKACSYLHIPLLVNISSIAASWR